MLQSRFLANINCNFDIDARVEEESLISKIQTDCILWDDIFSFGRGVEISKTGEVTVCEHCGDAQGYTSAQFNSKRKICTSCQSETRVDIDTTRIIINIGRKKRFFKDNSWRRLTQIHLRNKSLYRKGCTRHQL